MASFEFSARCCSARDRLSRCTCWSCAAAADSWWCCDRSPASGKLVARTASAKTPATATGIRLRRSRGVAGAFCLCRFFLEEGLPAFPRRPSRGSARRRDVDPEAPFAGVDRDWAIGRRLATPAWTGFRSRRGPPDRGPRQALAGAFGDFGAFGALVGLVGLVCASAGRALSGGGGGASNASAASVWADSGASGAAMGVIGSGASAAAASRPNPAGSRGAAITDGEAGSWSRKTRGGLSSRRRRTVGTLTLGSRTRGTLT